MSSTSIARRSTFQLLENHIVYPKPGQLVYYYLPSRTYASMHVHKERMGDVDTAEVAIWYGPGD